MNENNFFTPLTIEPGAIEKESFRIIDTEIGQHRFSPDQYSLVQRVIHATADFELGKSMVFHPDAISSGIDGIKSGKHIITDVSMVQSGISKPRLEKFGCRILTYINDPEVIANAKAQNLTRSILATRKAAEENPEGIFVIGNAPTALLELINLVIQKKVRPSLIIGLPVGFVSASESKADLIRLNSPFISNVGRKGGTPAAVATFNALSLLASY